MEYIESEDKPPSTKRGIDVIYVSNILEGYYKNYNALKSRVERNFWTQYDTYDSNRALLYGDDNKIIVTSFPIYTPHFEDLKHLMGWKRVENYFPIHATHSISEDCMKDKELQQKVIQIITDNPGIALIPYRLTPQFQKLIHFLKSKNLRFETPETIPEEKQFVLNYFNTKRGFRHLWSISGAENPSHVQIPEGFITMNKKELIDAAWWFAQQKQSFIIKYNPGTQGIGIQRINYKTLPKDKKKFEAYMRKLLTDKMWNEPIIIIEKAVPPNDKAVSISPSIEMYISPEGIVSKSYACDQILASDKRTFRGIYTYPELITDPAIQKVFESGIKFGKKLAKFGYRGVFDIDLIRSNDTMYAVEANLRRTGGTHLHEFSRALLGKRYGNSYHSLIEDIMLKKKHNLTYEQCRELFKKNLFSHATKTGIIFANPDMLKVNILVIVIVAKTKKEIKYLRGKIEAVLKDELTSEALATGDW